MDERLAGGHEGLLLLVIGPGAFWTRPLDPESTVTIGRAPSSAVRIEDPLASRKHAELRTGDRCTIQDLGSANGTRVRGRRIPPRELVPLSEGDVVQIGSAVILLQREADAGARRLWSHGYFETRLERECKTPRSAPLSVLRLRFDQAAPWHQIAPVLAGAFHPPHFLATYGPNEYEGLLIGMSEPDVEAFVRTLQAHKAFAPFAPRIGTAHFPKDGQSPDALIASAGGRVAAVARDRPTPRPAESSAMAPVVKTAERAALSKINVLLLGETGTGKEVLTKFIHRTSPRQDRPLVCINCAGIQETLLESELFGFERGAFTGAIHAKAGLLESADRGTVLLDEIGELPLVLQAKLLRVIESREVMRVGALKPRSIDVRFISATHRDLEREVAAGRFREDLFFRLAGITISIPPLRERREEIPALVSEFLRDACKDAGRETKLELVPAAVDALLQYSWPGNIRELKNVIERAVALCTGDEVNLEHLPIDKFEVRGTVDVNEFRADRTTQRLISPTIHEAQGDPPIDLDLSYEQLKERARIVELLQQCAGNQTRVAQVLGMPRRTLVFKLRAYRIPRPRASLRTSPHE